MEKSDSKCNYLVTKLPIDGESGAVMIGGEQNAKIPINIHTSVCL